MSFHYKNDVLFNIVCLNMFSHWYIDAYAPTEGQTNVFLCTVSQFGHTEGIFPWRAVQQEQHSSTRKMVQ